VAAFIGQPPNDGPTLSPDGMHFAVQRMKGGVETVDVIRVDDGAVVSSFLFKEDVNVFDHGWIDNQTLMLRSRMGDPYWQEFPLIGRFHRFDITNNKVEKLFVRQAFTVGREDGELRERFGGYPVRLSHNIFPDSFDARVIVRKETVSEVFRYDMLRESYDSLARISGNIVDVYTDDAGNVLVAYGKPRQEGKTFNSNAFLHYRASGDADWQSAYEGPFDDGSVAIIGKGPKENTVYLLETITGDMAALSILNLMNGEITNVFRPARADVHSYYLDGSQELYAVRYDDHFPQWFYPNGKHLAAQIHQLIRGRFDTMNVDLSFSHDNSRAIATVSGDANPGTYYLFDTDGNKLKKLFDRNPALADFALGERHPLDLQGRDKRRIPAYVNLPKKPKKNMPFIVWVRDGPNGFPATWGYDPEAQFFASQGIGVLTVNHRGKMGFGESYTKAGFGEWANYIPDDITAGVNHLIEQDIADADRICVVGRRFGAYLAMLMALEHRRMYRCVVGIAGFYDLVGIWKFLPQRGARERFEETTVGVASASEDRFKDASPRWRARQLRIPAMIVEGQQYRNSIGEQTMDLVREFRAGELDHELVILDNERTDNWLTDEEKRLAFQTIADFVQTHTAPR